MPLRIYRSEVVAATINALAAPVAALLAFGFENAALSLAQEWQQTWFFIAIYTVPSFLAGGFVYALVATLLQSKTEKPRWLPRNAVPLLLIGGLVAVIIVDWSYPDFWMVAWFVIFPLFALIGGLTADTLIGAQMRKKAVRAAA